jgi:hypothetical protein
LSICFYYIVAPIVLACLLAKLTIVNKIRACINTLLLTQLISNHHGFLTMARHFSRFSHLRKVFICKLHADDRDNL